MNIPPGATIVNKLAGATTVSYKDEKGVTHLTHYREDIPRIDPPSAMSSAGFIQSNGSASLWAGGSPSFSRGGSTASISKFANSGASGEAMRIQKLVTSAIGCGGSGGSGQGSFDIGSIYGEGNNKATILDGLASSVDSINDFLSQIENSFNNGNAITQKVLSDFDSKIDEYRSKLQTNGLDDLLGDFDSMFDSPAAKKASQIAGCMSRSNTILQAAPIASLAGLIDGLSGVSSFVQQSLQALRSGAVPGIAASLAAGSKYLDSLGDALGVAKNVTQTVNDLRNQSKTAFSTTLETLRSKLNAHTSSVNQQLANSISFTNTASPAASFIKSIF